MDVEQFKRERLGRQLCEHAIRGEPDGVAQMLALGAPSTFLDEEGRTALMAAIFSGSLACVKHLAPVSDLSQTGGGGATALICAASMRKAFADLAGIVEAILPGSPLGARSSTGMSALDMACSLGNYSAAEAIVKYAEATGQEDYKIRGADDMTPLMWAARLGDPSLAAFMVERSDPDAAIEIGFTALRIAIDSGSFECSKLLIPVTDVRVSSVDNVSCRVAIEYNHRFDVAQVAELLRLHDCRLASVAARKEQAALSMSTPGSSSEGARRWRGRI